MFEIPSLKRETRYGTPAADLLLFNRFYVLGYSYYFRQAKWAMEIIDSKRKDVSRSNNFRPDYRVPESFRADLIDYTGSGYDRGHLIASADQIETEIQNSETFLLSNMSPQEPSFNRKTWRKLEIAVRELNDKKKILEVYVICGPIFYFDKAVVSIGEEDDNEVSLPIPHAYFKSILAENNTGRLQMWSFIMENKDLDQPLETCLVPTEKVEKLSGLSLWERLVGTKITREKKKVRKMWKS